MRKSAVLVAATLFVCAAAEAKKPKNDPRVAFVDDEPMSLRVVEAPRPVRTSDARGLDDTTLRSASAMRGPEVGRVDGKSGPLTEAQPVAPSHGDANAPISGALEEL